MKSNKLLKFGILALSLGALAACGGDEPEEPTPEEHVCVADTAAGWQTNGTKHWHKCTDSTCKKHVDEANHALGEETVTAAATCTVAGSKKQVCSVCNYEKTSSISPLGHVYEQVDGADKVVWSQEATCTEGGTGSKTCTRTGCGEVTPVTADPLGHSWGEDHWTTEASCGVAGVGDHTCSRCSTTEPISADALVHNFQLVGDDTTEPEEGKAKVRVYTCENGCGQTTLGFKATEVTARSMQTLYKVTNGDKEGYRFFGHPIGNDVALDDTGSASESAHVAVYNKEQQGDFFEYVFDLTAEQVKEIEYAELHCEATPADWMQNNRVDFWKVKGDAASDWTYGMYIDDAPEHAPTARVDADGNPVLDDEGNPVLDGVVVEDFRYVLYVDDELQTMDSSKDTTAGANNSIGDYVLPYTFHLHAGENKIRLVMSGGYRSVFYNFTFQAVDAPAKKAAVTATTNAEGAQELTWAAYDQYNRSNGTITQTADGAINKWGAVSNGSATTAPDDTKRTFVEYVVNSPKDVAKAGLSFEVYRNSGTTASWFKTEAGDQSKYYEADPTNPGSFVQPKYRWIIKVNDQLVNFTAAADDVTQKSKVKEWVDFKLEDFPLVKGENKIYIETTGGYGGDIHNFKLTEKLPTNFKVFSYDDVKAGATGGSEKTNADESLKFLKLGTTNDKITLTYESAAAETVILRVLCANKMTNVGQKMFGQNGTKFAVKVNDVAATIISSQAGKTMAECGLSSTEGSGVMDGSDEYCKAVYVDFSEIQLAAGTNTIEITYTGGGYSLSVAGVALAK